MTKNTIISDIWAANFRNERKMAAICILARSIN